MASGLLRKCSLNDYDVRFSHFFRSAGGCAAAASSVRNSSSSSRSSGSLPPPPSPPLHSSPPPLHRFLPAVAAAGVPATTAAAAAGAVAAVGAWPALRRRVRVPAFQTDVRERYARLHPPRMREAVPAGAALKLSRAAPFPSPHGRGLASLKTTAAVENCAAGEAPIEGPPPRVSKVPARAFSGPAA